MSEQEAITVGRPLRLPIIAGKAREKKKNREEEAGENGALGEFDQASERKSDIQGTGERG